MEKKTKIVCTIGPATESEEMLVKMAKAGMNVCRLNFSHDVQEQHLKKINRIRKVERETGMNFSILLDTKGPEIRTGVFKNGQEFFNKGDLVTLCKEWIEGTKDRFHIQCPEVFDDVYEGGTILIDDGKIRLTILEKRPDELLCRVENPGTIKNRKGCNVPGVRLSMPFISKKDEDDIRFACRHNLDFIAASFTRRKQDILDIRRILQEEGNDHIQIIAKIENQEGYDNLDEILNVSDGIMVARGDLGVDVSVELVPIYQKKMIKRANEFGKPVITATHMLESMQHNPRSTRAEASDVANSILDGTDAIMLSGESAVGSYPIEAVRTMVKIASGMEQMIDYGERLNYAIDTARRTKEDAIGISAADCALKLNAAAIICFTSSGNSVKRVSKYRSKTPIIAVCFNKEVERSLALQWGVTTYLSKTQNTQLNEVELACSIAKEHGVKEGETILIVAGYPQGSGATNTLKIIDVL